MAEIEDDEPEPAPRRRREWSEGEFVALLTDYLRDIGWPHGGAIDVVQGEDMGSRSLLHAQIPAEAGSSIRVSGTARWM